jgi:hypothetical protein
MRSYDCKNVGIDEILSGGRISECIVRDLFGCIPYKMSLNQYSGGVQYPYNGYRENTFYGK